MIELLLTKWLRFVKNTLFTEFPKLDSQFLRVWQVWINNRTTYIKYAYYSQNVSSSLIHFASKKYPSRLLASIMTFSYLKRKSIPKSTRRRFFL